MTRLLLITTLSLSGFNSSAATVLCDVFHGNPGPAVMRDLKIAAKKTMPLKDNESFDNVWTKYVQILISGENVAFVYKGTPLAEISGSHGTCGQTHLPSEVISHQLKADKSGVEIEKLVRISKDDFPLPNTVHFDLSLKAGTSGFGFGTLTCESSPIGSKLARMAIGHCVTN